MSFSNSLEQSLIALLFNATAITNVADNAASSPLTNTQLSLHTADPGEAGTQTTSEIGYTSYARAAVARTSGGWTCASGTATLAALTSFPAGTGGSGTATHAGVGTASSGTGVLWGSGALSVNIVTGNTITPQLTTSTTISID